MNKADLVAQVSKETGQTQQDVTAILESTLETIKNSLKNGNKVTLVGFGSFEVKTRKARRGVNPRTGEAITIPSSKVPKFTAGKALREMVKA